MKVKELMQTLNDLVSNNIEVLDYEFIISEPECSGFYELNPEHLKIGKLDDIQDQPFVEKVYFEEYPHEYDEAGYGADAIAIVI